MADIKARIEKLADAASPDVSDGGKRLAGKSARNLGGRWGFFMALFGVPFAAIGVGIVLVAADVIKVDPSSIHVPRWVLGVVGAIFGLPGLFLIVAGLVSGVRQRRLKALAAQHPDDYWLADHQWDPAGDRDRPLGKVIGAVAMAVFVTVFLIPFDYFVFYKREAPIFAMVIIGLFNLIPIGALGAAVYYLMRYLKYGGARVRYQQFPYFLGEACEILFEPSRGIGNYRSITFTLRCLQEITVTTGSGKNRSTTTHVYELWSDEFKVEQEGHHAGGEPVPLTFLLPEETRFGSRIAGFDKPIYWELEVHADTPGVDYRAAFLVPVYGRKKPLAGWD